MPPRQQDTTPGSVALARRLRELRQEWPGTRVTQTALADALGASTALISSWESLSSPILPPANRLLSYANLFATRRSLEGGQLHLLPDEEFTADELAVRDDLYAELAALRASADRAPDPGEPDVSLGLWHFPDEAPVRLVCGVLPQPMRGAYASTGNPNFSRLHLMADPDAIVELFGHLRMLNPDSDVRFMLAEELKADDLTAHIVLIGGFDRNPAARFFTQLTSLPVVQVDDENVEDGDVFEIVRDGRRRRFLPTFSEGDPDLGLIEDVGLFARMPNPNLPQRTLTICNGVFSRGVLGAVRILTDARVRDTNDRYLASRFLNGKDFGLLLRVPVYGGEVSTPNLTSDYHRLFVWSREPREDPA